MRRMKLFILTGIIFLSIQFCFTVSFADSAMDHSQHQSDNALPESHNHSPSAKSSNEPDQVDANPAESPKTTSSEHQHHAASSKRNVHESAGNEIQKLNRLPDSGKAREAGFDNRYVMESITLDDNFELLCAKASRGVIMLDNKQWQRCGGKPDGLPGEKSRNTEEKHLQHQQGGH